MASKQTPCNYAEQASNCIAIYAIKYSSLIPEEKIPFIFLIVKYKPLKQLL